ncbi:cytochrome b561 domain-containing protein [uncultured Tateyamaria sp.]|uniref:cytochrome b561 domain-containing protein n=1 Tax=uncultured Tateyamaria sp. TaxID=455651 RepID=UPI00261BE467|nr:cytochrome b561 domain-containing protein [uncultured Tateyamaria sp.]
MDWLIAPIDPSRAHEVGFAISWHARSMVLAWGVLAPLAVIIARFFKVMPGQDWPREVDNLVWWRSHWMGQSLVVGLSIFGVALVLPSDLASMTLHNWLGYAVLVGAGAQVILGVFRGSKGGPTDTQMRGHHYDMTPWRRMFEALHKMIGYGVILLAVVTILLGLWKANGPVWMWLVLGVWWTLLVVLFVSMQRRGMAIDTYQAIWGTDPAHPGNQGPPPGWGVHRFGKTKEGKDDVRSDRGDRVRSH